MTAVDGTAVGLTGVTFSHMVILGATTDLSLLAVLSWYDDAAFQYQRYLVALDPGSLTTNTAMIRRIISDGPAAEVSGRTEQHNDTRIVWTAYEPNTADPGEFIYTYGPEGLSDGVSIQPFFPPGATIHGITIHRCGDPDYLWGRESSLESNGSGPAEVISMWRISDGARVSTTTIKELDEYNELPPWERTTQNYRINRQVVSAPDQNHLIVHNYSPSVISGQPDIELMDTNTTIRDGYGGIYYWSTSARFHVHINETGLTRSGPVGIFSNAAVSTTGYAWYSREAAAAQPMPSGSVTVAGHTFGIGTYDDNDAGVHARVFSSVDQSRIPGWADSPDYLVFSKTWYFTISFDATVAGTGDFDAYINTSGPPWYLGKETFGLFDSANPTLHMTYTWDNTEMNGGRLELVATNTGTIVDTLPLPLHEDYYYPWPNYLTYAPGQVFTGSALFNPWDGTRPTADSFFWRIITVSGDSMSYSPVHSYTLPAHFTWQDDFDIRPGYRYVNDVAFGVWNNQVVVHPIAHTSTCG